jgi:ribonucleoside-diphosphate reductase alpha chain
LTPDSPQQTELMDVASPPDNDRVGTAVVNGSSNSGASGKTNGSNGRVKVAGTEKPSARGAGANGLTINRYFTKAGENVYDTVEWELRDAVISNERGEKVFEQIGVEIPKTWTQLATNVVVSKYFRGHIGTPQRERSVRQLIGRVADTMANWGRAMEYFATEDDAQAFQDELTHLLLHQKGAFNSPVWFNVGLPENPRPQCSACFINSVDDTMESILTLAKTEGMLFKYGSGTGTNLSPIRGSREPLNGGGTASGPLSFMRGFDQFAGAIKSGGKTRRAAKMVILNVDHPDIVDFIESKEKEEKKAWALIDAGYSGAFNVPGGAYDSVQFQNANHSVRVTDEFMQAVEKNGDWTTYSVLGQKQINTYKARDLMSKIAESAWVCGDPGMQYDTTINTWHTCKNTDRIHASNPCSEYMFLNDSACNLASLNLMKFRRADGEFDPESFAHACRIFLTAQEIIVDNASYPTPRIGENSHDYRPLGLGYANLGALLMARGVPYDSPEGFAYAGAITALMTGTAYHQSSLIARDHGWTFPGYAKNRDPFLDVMRMHRAAVDDIDSKLVPKDLLQAARQSWDDTVNDGEKYGFRNAQATVLAPTGTIGFLMDCDTTGIEPDIAIVKYKSLVGGGMLKIVNNTVPEALTRLGYNDEQRREIIAYIDANDTIEGAPFLKDEHLPVFDCAFKPSNGTRSIHYMGHVRMMAAAQPFISGAISKTVNMPHEATSDEIALTYMEGWKLGLKAIAIYRDGSKRTQPLQTKRFEEEKEEAKAEIVAPAPTPAPVPEVRRPMRRKLPDERLSITHKFSIAGHEGYITVGMYEDGTPGEIFLTMSKEGSTISGLMDSFATAISLALQYGVPLQTLVDKFSHSRFEPSGVTNNPDVRFAKSIMDYIFRWLGLKFLNRTPNAEPSLTNGEQNGLNSAASALLASPAAAPNLTLNAMDERGTISLTEREQETFQNQADAPICTECGSLMVRNGACFKCLNCGSVFGCS